MAEKPVHNLLHELGTSLTVIKSLVCLLMEKKNLKADSESRKMLEEIKNQNEKAVDIILEYNHKWQKS